MTRISSIKRCLRLAGNAVGRDLVVGDLHGHRNLLEQQLELHRFDPGRDRVFSVGDLVNRGPDSLGTLALVEEPWFHAVLGNHDLMLLNYLGYYSSRIHSRASYPSGAGDWIKHAQARHPKQLRRLAERLARLPLAIHVEARIPFNVMHGDLAPIGSRQDRLFDQDDVCVHDADRSASSRQNFHEALGRTLFNLPFKNRVIRISDCAFRSLNLTYVGHSPVREVLIHNSYIYIDQGVCQRPPRWPESKAPTVVDHGQFSTWLHGVASAWRPAPLPANTPGAASRPRAAVAAAHSAS